VRRTLFTCRGGDIALPDRRLVLIDRRDGGNLVVMPPREVWDRGELSLTELTRWSSLVAATGSAMLEKLPQLDGGCINYWDAGNWGLNDEAEPAGVRKNGRAHRKLHLHLLGRSRTAVSESVAWGEAPRFPAFRDRYQWAAHHERLTADECRAVLSRVTTLLEERYEMPGSDQEPWIPCGSCRYPVPADPGVSEMVCVDCKNQD